MGKAAAMPLTYITLNNSRIMSKQLNRIKVILAEKQLTNKWLADELHRDQTTVSRWVTNTCQPSFKTMIKIANALNVTLDDLARRDII